MIQKIRGLEKKKTIVKDKKNYMQLHTLSKNTSAKRQDKFSPTNVVLKARLTRVRWDFNYGLKGDDSWN